MKKKMTDNSNKKQWEQYKRKYKNKNIKNNKDAKMMEHIKLTQKECNIV